MSHTRIWTEEKAGGEKKLSTRQLRTSPENGNDHDVVRLVVGLTKVRHR